jgi:hypothetical protein
MKKVERHVAITCLACAVPYLAESPKYGDQHVCPACGHTQPYGAKPSDPTSTFEDYAAATRWPPVHVASVDMQQSLPRPVTVESEKTAPDRWKVSAVYMSAEDADRAQALLTAAWNGEGAKLNVPELVDSARAIGLPMFVIDENTDFSKLPKLT